MTDTTAKQAPAFSEDALALRFSKRHADDLRYVAAWSKWLQWDGTRWAFDRTVNVYDMARAVCREAAAECNDKSSKRIAAAVTRAARRAMNGENISTQMSPAAANTPHGSATRLR